LWWIEAGKYPSIEDSIERFEFLQAKEATERAFDFKEKFFNPNAIKL